MSVSSLEFQAYDRFVFRPIDMGKLEDFYAEDLIARVKDCHIYLICKKPRVSIISVAKIGSAYELEIQYRVRGTPTNIRLQISQQEVDSAAGFEVNDVSISDYPHSDLLLFGVSALNEIVFDSLGFVFAGLPESLRNLEVLYVGRSDDSAKDRLSNHETLQKVLSSANATFVDDIIMCAIFNFPIVSDNVASSNLRDVIEKKRKMGELNLSIEQITDLVEACLIGYFKPEYNKIYKATFPQEDHLILQEVMGVGVNTLSVNLCTSQLNLRTFSQSVLPSDEHFFHTDIDFVSKKSFFDFFK